MAFNKCRVLRKVIAIYILFPHSCISQMILPPYQLTVYDSSVKGYYFLATKKMDTDQSGYFPVQLVLDELGKVVYYRPERAINFSVQPNGLITYYRDQRFVILDSTFTPIDSVKCSKYITDAHEFQILSNHHYLLLGQQDSVMDLSSYHYFNHNGSAGSTNATVTGCVIQELDSNKQLVFEWLGLEHLPFSSVNPFWLSKPDTVDWSHSNALDLDSDGNILLSSRHLCEITKINRTTGNVMWRMGGNYNEFTFVNDPFAFRGQHDIRRTANGNLTLFDNGWYSAPHEARGVEYQVDEINKVATLVWSYVYDSTLSSKATGNCQRIPGSLSLVNIGHREFGNHAFSVVDAQNNQISELSFFDSTVVYRAFFYRNLPWSFHRPVINCNMEESNIYLSTSAPYTSYIWSTGQTTASVRVTTPGNYYVLVNYGEGYIRSEDFEVVNMSNPCDTVASATQNNCFVTNKGKVYPNPNNGKMTYESVPCGNTSAQFKIFDMTGRQAANYRISDKSGILTINLQHLSAGIYHFAVTLPDKKIIDTGKLALIK